jgi:hypothetical protein
MRCGLDRFGFDFKMEWFLTTAKMGFGRIRESYLRPVFAQIRAWTGRRDVACYVSAGGLVRIKDVE